MTEEWVFFNQLYFSQLYFLIIINIQRNVVATIFIPFRNDLKIRSVSTIIFPPFLYICETIEHNLQPSHQCYRCRVHCWAPLWEPQRGCSWWSSWSCWLSSCAIDPDLRRTLMTTAGWRTWRHRGPTPRRPVTNRRPCPSAPIASRALRRIPT